MTRRERIKAKIEKRDEWAGKASAKADALASTASEMARAIPLGQPILVGHHSEKRDRNYRSRISDKFDRAREQSDLASHHRSKASGLAHQLDRSIFSDDPDAVEALRAKIEGLEQRRAWCKRVNAAWRKAGKPEPTDTQGWESIALALGCPCSALAVARQNLASMPYHKQPHPAYESQNIGGNITRLKKRILDIERRAERSAEAEDAGGVLIVTAGDAGQHARVTFAEKPEHSVIRDLRAAGFHWSGGSWHGSTDAIPQSIKETP